VACGDLDELRLGKEPAERRCGAVARDGPSPEREHRRGHMTFVGVDRTAEGIDPAVYAEQLFAADSRQHLVARDTEPRQLGGRDYSVLAAP
jgi:hypothetical protein